MKGKSQEYCYHSTRPVVPFGAGSAAPARGGYGGRTVAGLAHGSGPGGPGRRARTGPGPTGTTTTRDCGAGGRGAAAA